MKTLLVMGIILILLLASIGIVSANLVSNGGFEDPLLPYGTLQQRDMRSGLTSWTIESGNIDIIRALWKPAGQSQSIDLSGCERGTISQSINTDPNGIYSLSFALSGNPYNDPPGPNSVPPFLKTVEVFWNGESQGTFDFDTTGHTNSNMGWITVKIPNLKATTKHTILKFSDVSALSAAGTAIIPSSNVCYGIVLDNINLEPQGVVSPTTIIETSSITATISKDTSGQTVMTDQKLSTGSVQGDFSQLTFIFLFAIIACMMLGGIFIYTKRSSGSINTVKPSDRTISEPARADSGTKTSMNINDRKNSSFNQDVIISYSSHDKAVADAICNSLESQKIRCWYAPRDILPGMNFQESIIDAIDTSSIMVVIFSSHSNDSPHVISEVTEAMAKGVIIIPFRIEDIMPSKAMKYLISASHWLDAMTPPLEQHIEKLVETVKVLLKKQK